MLSLVERQWCEMNLQCQQHILHIKWLFPCDFRHIKDTQNYFGAVRFLYSVGVSFYGALSLFDTFGNMVQ